MWLECPALSGGAPYINMSTNFDHNNKWLKISTFLCLLKSYLWIGLWHFSFLQQCCWRFVFWDVMLLFVEYFPMFLRTVMPSLQDQAAEEEMWHRETGCWCGWWGWWRKLWLVSQQEWQWAAGVVVRQWEWLTQWQSPTSLDTSTFSNLGCSWKLIQLILHLS